MSASVYLKDRSFIGSKDSCCYLVAKGGLYLRKENAAFRSCVRMGKLSWENQAFGNGILDEEEFLEMKLPKIPARIVDEWVTLGRMVRKAYKSEVLLLLFYSPVTGEFQNKVPAQEVSPSSVRSKECIPARDGFILVGTVHTHPDKAFHSNVDQKDESDFDGLHLTIGDLDDILPGFAVSAVVNGRRFPLPPEEVMEMVEIPEEWLQKIRRV
jgi:proteasome lid subunit RPN8/RPN11